MNCKSWLTYLLKFVAIWILCGFNTMVTGVPQELACPEEVSESLLIVLENGVSLQRTIPADFKVKIECPFRQPLWYHNEHPMTINDTLVITALKAKHHSDNYGCKTLENEKDVATKWANVTLIGCTSIAENVKDDLVLRKWHNMDDALSKRELQLLSKEATAYFTSTIPSISTATINRTALLDENVNLKCHAGDSPLVRIVWLKHYAPLNWTEKSVFNFDHNLNVWKLPTSNSEPRLLRLGSVQPEDEGWYSCVATTANQLETVIFSNYLKILNYPVDWDNFNNRSTSEFHREDTDSFDVSVESRVRKIAKKVDDNDQDNVEVTKREDGPQFKNVKKLEDNIHKPSGSSVQLMCPATGNPTPNITWTRNNTEIERTMGRVSYKKWSIQMDDATTEDSGVYKCTICNQHGCIEHSTKVTIRDRLRSPPIISDKFPQNQTVLVNNSTYLECRVVSDLEPSIKWFKYALRRNVTIKELEQTALKTVNKVTNDHNFLLDSVVTLSPDPDKPNILNFTNITHEDEGWYTCVASNTLGHSLASAYMRVVDKLPARDHTPLRSHPVWITAVAVVVVLLFLLGTVFIIYVLRKLKHEKLLKQRIETVHQWTKKVIIYRPPTTEASSNCGDLQMPVIKIEKQRTTFTTSSSSDPMQGFNEYEFPLDSNWEIPRSQLVLGSVLGEGAFGRVVMGEANDLSTPQRPTGTTTIVAVKMVKEEHTDADMTSLVHEMEVMKMIGKHINIINLLGCCSQNGPLWVIVEFAPHGNLKDFLKKNRPLSTWNGRNPEYLKKDEECVQLTEKHLISFAFQIARGMEYLASRRTLPDKVVVKQKDLLQAFNTTRPTLTAAEIAKYQRTYAKFTNKDRSFQEPVTKRTTLA